MNKTVTINISGIIFHIEEEAYDILSKYLNTIKGYFSHTDGGNEIMSDIEARVAELLQAKLNSGKQVIVMSDVELVMQVMGKPEDFVAEQAHSEGASNTNDQKFAGESDKINRRLFRNPDDKLLGGVCSGLSTYFDVDVVWVRLVMLVLISFGGLSLWVYFIMWLIIPEAKTTADKLAMRGESANINNIMRNFKEGADDMKSHFSRSRRSFKNRHYGENIRSGISSVLSSLFNIMARLVGFIILMIGLSLLVGYIASLTGISLASTYANVSYWKAVIFESPADYTLAIVAFIIVAGVPVFMLLYTGIKLLFKVRYSNRWLNLSLGFVWLTGLILGFYITISTIRYFSEISKIRQTAELRNIGDTIIVKMNLASACVKDLNVSNEEDFETYFGRTHSRYYFAEYYNDGPGIVGYATLNVSESNNDSVELLITQSARGISKKDANENAHTIKYQYSRNKNVLLFDEIFFVHPDHKFRVQKVDIKLRLPKGKVVYFDKSMKQMLDDVENTTNTWDGDMVSRRWKMTDKGLSCIDCDNLKVVDDEDDDDYKRHRGHEKIEISTNGIEIRNEDAHIKIDGDIKIKTLAKEQQLENGEKK